MAWVQVAIAVASTVMNMQAQAEEEEATRKSNYKRAEMLDKKAELAVAAGQRDMLSERRKKELIASRALALSAFSGAVGVDVVDILADIEGEGTYRESVALYQGEQEAQALREQAGALREGVQMMEAAAPTRRAATALRGASSIYRAYGSAYG